MSKRAPWFWNRAVLARVAWLLMAVVFAAYAFQALTHWRGNGIVQHGTSAPSVAQYSQMNG